MGHEIRMVPPNWEHPRYTKDNAPCGDRVGDYIPMRDEDYESARQEWLNGLQSWLAETHKDYHVGMDYWEWDSPPDRESYRPKFNEEPTWFQIYETVSEGTPTSPPFATKEELARYLSENGDFAYQRGYRDISPKPTYINALKFIEQ